MKKTILTLAILASQVTFARGSEGWGLQPDSEKMVRTAVQHVNSCYDSAQMKIESQEYSVPEMENLIDQRNDYEILQRRFFAMNLNMAITNEKEAAFDPYKPFTAFIANASNCQIVRQAYYFYPVSASDDPVAELNSRLASGRGSQGLGLQRESEALVRSAVQNLNRCHDITQDKIMSLKFVGPALESLIDQRDQTHRLSRRLLIMAFDISSFSRKEEAFEPYKSLVSYISKASDCQKLFEASSRFPVSRTEK